MRALLVAVLAACSYSPRQATALDPDGPNTGDAPPLGDAVRAIEDESGPMRRVEGGERADSNPGSEVLDPPPASGGHHLSRSRGDRRPTFEELTPPAVDVQDLLNGNPKGRYE